MDWIQNTQKMEWSLEDEQDKLSWYDQLYKRLKSYIPTLPRLQLPTIPGSAMADWQAGRDTQPPTGGWDITKAYPGEKDVGFQGGPKGQFYDPNKLEGMGLPANWYEKTYGQQAQTIHAGLPEFIRVHSAGWGDAYAGFTGVANRLGFEAEGLAEKSKVLSALEERTIPGVPIFMEVGGS